MADEPRIELGWYIPAQIKDGQRRVKPRWVLAATRTHVLYGTGDRQHKECQARVFRQWVARTKAVRASER